LRRGTLRLAERPGPLPARQGCSPAAGPLAGAWARRLQGAAAALAGWRAAAAMVVTHSRVLASRPRVSPPGGPRPPAGLAGGVLRVSACPDWHWQGLHGPAAAPTLDTACMRTASSCRAGGGGRSWDAPPAPSQPPHAKSELPLLHAEPRPRLRTSAAHGCLATSPLASTFIESGLRGAGVIPFVTSSCPARGGTAAGVGLGVPATPWPAEKRMHASPGHHHPARWRRSLLPRRFQGRVSPARYRLQPRLYARQLPEYYSPLLGRRFAARFHGRRAGTAQTGQTSRLPTVLQKESMDA
jgi:hypothetical protein